MFFVSYLPEFHYQSLKLSNVRPTDFANSKHIDVDVAGLTSNLVWKCNRQDHFA